MSYQVLARKWRPKNFTEMVGQPHVLKALVNALDEGRLHHAYLFTGTRGVGKTSIARLFAKSLNCLEGVSANPCGVCAACREIAEGRFVDLIEVDAASRTKVEDTRDLLENVQYAPTHGRFKVYLIDEVHMLSSHSFNALLKTLEEPPEHVKFLLATTDPQKLPMTILSRCLQFNLKNMVPEAIVAHLSHVLGEENIAFEEAALWLLARSADGSMRDAMSLTDQAIAFGAGSVNEADVRAMLGTIDLRLVYNLLTHLIEGNGKALLAAINELASFSPDYASVLADLLSLLHRVALGQAVPDAIDNSLGDRERVLAFSQSMRAEDVQLYYQIGLMGRKDLPFAPDAREGLEMIMLRMLSFRPASFQPQEREPSSQNPNPTLPQSPEQPNTPESPLSSEGASGSETPADEQAAPSSSAAIDSADVQLEAVEQAPRVREPSAEATVDPSFESKGEPQLDSPATDHSVLNDGVSKAPHSADDTPPWLTGDTTDATLKPAGLVPSVPADKGPEVKASESATSAESVVASESSSSQPEPMSQSEPASWQESYDSEPSQAYDEYLNVEPVMDYGEAAYAPEPEAVTEPALGNEGVATEFTAVSINETVGELAHSHLPANAAAVTPQHWAKIHTQLGLRGLVSSIAAQLSLEQASSQQWVFHYGVQQASVLSEVQRQKIADAIVNYFKTPIAIEFVRGECHFETPVQTFKRWQLESEEQAEAKIREADAFKRLENTFGEELVFESRLLIESSDH